MSTAPAGLGRALVESSFEIDDGLTNEDRAPVAVHLGLSDLLAWDLSGAAWIEWVSDATSKPGSFAVMAIAWGVRAARLRNGEYLRAIEHDVVPWVGALTAVDDQGARVTAVVDLAAETCAWAKKLPDRLATKAVVGAMIAVAALQHYGSQVDGGRFALLLDRLTQLENTLRSTDCRAAWLGVLLPLARCFGTLPPRGACTGWSCVHDCLLKVQRPQGGDRTTIAGLLETMVRDALLDWIRHGGLLQQLALQVDRFNVLGLAIDFVGDAALVALGDRVLRLCGTAGQPDASPLRNALLRLACAAGEPATALAQSVRPLIPLACEEASSAADPPQDPDDDPFDPSLVRACIMIADEDAGRAVLDLLIKLCAADVAARLDAVFLSPVKSLTPLLARLLLDSERLKDGRTLLRFLPGLDAVAPTHAQVHRLRQLVEHRPGGLVLSEEWRLQAEPRQPAVSEHDVDA